MKFKIIKQSKVISETIEFVFEYEDVKYIGRIHDDGNGNSFSLLNENYISIDSGDVYETFINTFFDQWKYLEQNEILDTEGDDD